MRSMNGMRGMIARRSRVMVYGCRTMAPAVACRNRVVQNVGARHYSLLRKIFDDSRAEKVAVIDRDGKKFTFGELRSAALRLSDNIVKFNRGAPVKCIANYNNSSCNYVITALAAWHLGAIMVPLSPAHTANELEYFIRDSQCDVIVHSVDLPPPVPTVPNPTTTDNKTSPTDICVPAFVIPSDALSQLQPVSSSAEDSYASRSDNDAALILYTSGTTGRPKGVVHTHSTLHHMVLSLAEAWEIKAKDHVLHFLPLHHLHGVLNQLLCMLASGASLEFLKSANAEHLWATMASCKEGVRPSPTIFMAVPTIYSRLLSTFANQKPQVQQAALQCIRDMRVMTCGSAALPDPVLGRWKDLTGHTLLERYGMTEIGMGLSNPLHGERRAGTVGTPLKYISARIVDEDEEDITASGNPGELRVKGPTVFKEYLNRPKDTTAAFDKDGWFRTGDVAVREKDTGVYRLLGRSSIDIIKSCGYKLSALEIEREILGHPDVCEVAVVGKPDEYAGEIVVAIVMLNRDCIEELTYEALRAFLNDRLANYKHPRVLHIVESIPRNHLGKVVHDIYTTYQ